MKANQHMDDLHRKVVKKWHTLAKLCGLSEDDKLTVLRSYGVESSADMQTHDLIDVCGTLQKQLDKRTGAIAYASEMDKLRKRCLRCLCDYITTKGIDTNNRINYAKQMACRAAKKNNFNRLTAAELRGIIGYFNQERKTFENARTMTGGLPERKETEQFDYHLLLNIQPRGEA